MKQLRKEQRLSQAQLALMIGRDRSYISRIERGKVNATLITLLDLASGLGVPPAQLFTGIGERDWDSDEPPSIIIASPKRRR